MGDQVFYHPETKHVTLVKTNGTTFEFASYDDAHRWHKRGAFTIGDIPHFKCSARTRARILKHFYPDDSLRYLEKYGYIAS